MTPVVASSGRASVVPQTEQSDAPFGRPDVRIERAAILFSRTAHLQIGNQLNIIGTSESTGWQASEPSVTSGLRSSPEQAIGDSDAKLMPDPQGDGRIEHRSKIVPPVKGK
ncbi:hypothetical protein [Mesorhizobium captivum]|uniref:hypothetical protein n=1 Tax=Mesorhizobium captivum TaxID=3072319 RepID=UPI002A24203A|nr:hypothetical protein [Mesorhizobium sp. VK22E]